MIVSRILVLLLLSLGSSWRCWRWRASRLERQASPRIDVRRAFARLDEIRILGGNDRQRITAGGRHRVRLNSANQPNQIFQWLISGKSINYLELLNHLLFLSLAAREIPETLIVDEIILSVLDRLRQNGAQRLCWQHESDDGTNKGQDSQNG